MEEEEETGPPDVMHTLIPCCDTALLPVWCVVVVVAGTALRAQQACRGAVTGRAGGRERGEGKGVTVKWAQL